MFLINAHAIPTPKCEKYGEAIGAYAAIFVDYTDIDGAFALAEFYVTRAGWEIKEMEEEYFILESKDDVAEEKLGYYEEALQDGYSVVFYCYESEEDADDIIN